MTGPSTRPGRLLPVTDDRDTGGFWKAASDGRLAIRRCTSCGTFLHMPRDYCSECGSWDTEWTEVSGQGRLYSWTVAEHQVHVAYPVPYTIVLVELTDAPGVRLIGRIEGSPDLCAGEPMEVVFEDLGEGVTLPNWRTARV